MQTRLISVALPLALLAILLPTAHSEPVVPPTEVLTNPLREPLPTEQPGPLPSDAGEDGTMSILPLPGPATITDTFPFVPLESYTARSDGDSASITTNQPTPVSNPVIEETSSGTSPEETDSSEPPAEQTSESESPTPTPTQSENAGGKAAQAGLGLMVAGVGAAIFL